MKKILQTIVCFLAVYLCTAFVKCEVNASQWGEPERACMVMLSLLLVGMIFLKAEMDE